MLWKSSKNDKQQQKIWNYMLSNLKHLWITSVNFQSPQKIHEKECSKTFQIFQIKFDGERNQNKVLFRQTPAAVVRLTQLINSD